MHVPGLTVCVALDTRHWHCLQLLGMQLLLLTCALQGGGIGSQVHVLGLALAVMLSSSEITSTTINCPTNVLQGGGIGSQVHMLGLALAVALDLGRVLLLSPSATAGLFH